MSAAIDFLKVLTPNGPWWVCSIVPDGDLAGAGFAPSQAAELEQRIAARNAAGQNLYYQVNHVGVPPKNGKATKDNITAVRALFVDCDPRPKEDWNEERKRMLARLSSFVPAPSIIVSSGRGYQGIWILAEPVGLGAPPRGGEPPSPERDAKIADVESRLRWLANELEGDLAVAQIAALLRLPGLSAWPNKKKRSQGFTDPLPTEVAVADNGRRYSLADFKTAAGPAVKRALPGVDLPSQLRAIDVLMLDQWDPSGRLKLLAMHGHRVCEPPLNVEAPKLGDNSRSAWLFDFVCNAVRLKVPAEVIAGVMLDCNNGIAESVVEKRNPRRYATQQLGRAVAAVNAGSGRHELTDIGNGKRFVQAADGLFRFCFGTGVWFTYDDGRWRADDGGAVQALCKEVALKIKDEATSDADSAKHVLRWAALSQGRDRLNAMAWTARDEVAVDVDDLDADQWLLNCGNGTVDLRTGALRRHDPGDLLTKQAAVEIVPGAGCPMFLQFVDEVMQGDAEMVAYLRRVIGYSLTGDTREHAFFVLYGGGANGKSTLLKIVTTMLGDYAHTAQMAAFVKSHQSDNGPNEALASMRGARAVLASEIRNGAALDEQLVKNMTGGDKLRARFLHQNSFEFLPTFKVWLLVNHLPRITGTDHGIWRRVRVVPFLRKFAEAEQDKTLADRIIATELPGVLNWAISGCLEWQRDGLGTAKVIESATAVYRRKSDLVQQWMEDTCDTGPNWNVPVAWARANFLDWCAKNGERQLGKNEFASALFSHGFSSKNVKVDGVARRCYLGFKLKDMPAAQAVAQEVADEGGQYEAPF